MTDLRPQLSAAEAIINATVMLLGSDNILNYDYWRAELSDMIDRYHLDFPAKAAAVPVTEALPAKMPGRVAGGCHAS